MIDQIVFQFSGQSHFNQSARGSFGDSLAELDTSVGVSGHYSISNRVSDMIGGRGVPSGDPDQGHYFIAVNILFLP